MAGEAEVGVGAEDDRERIRAEIEGEIRTLGQKVAFILHPDQVTLRPCATLVFGPPPESPGVKPDPAVVDSYRRAVQVAQLAPRYWTEGEGRYLRHHARFEVEDADGLFELYRMTSEIPGNEVFIYDLPLPFARDLWLPMFWFHRS